MDELILDSIKQMLGLAADYDPFDAELTSLIDSALAVLCQLGAGPIEGYSIQTGEGTWGSFLGDTRFDLNMAKEYVFLYVKSIWDSSASGTIATAAKERLEELRYRIITQADTTGGD